MIFDTHRFPSDPTDTRLESNDVAILLRSDTRDHIDDAAKRLRDTKLFELTSIRRGFAGGGFDGEQSLPKRMAVAAQRPRRRPDPRHVRALPRLHVDAARRHGARADRELRDARLRRLPRQRLLPPRHAHAPVAHPRGPRGVVPQLRLRRARRDGVPAEPGRAPGHADRAARARRTSRPPPTCAATTEAPAASGTARRSRPRRASSTTLSAPDGTRYPKGTAIPRAGRLQHARQPVRVVGAADEIGALPAAGVHFVVFNPTGDDFRRNRLAMDGVLPGRQDPAPAARPRAGLQLGPLDDAPPELPRAAAPAPQLPARRALREGHRRFPSHLAEEGARDVVPARAARSSARRSPPRASTRDRRRRRAARPSARTRPRATRSAAFSPKRVARIRSRAVGSRRAGRARAR